MSDMCKVRPTRQHNFVVRRRRGRWTRSQCTACLRWDRKFPMRPRQVDYVEQVREAIRAGTIETDQDGCYTLSNGECVSPKPCLHTRAAVDTSSKCGCGVRHKPGSKAEQMCRYSAQAALYQSA